ncbi:MAG: flagellar basal body P-ring formation chaperone FlgA [Vulcanimicrobiaceae bacterium]
MRTILSLLGVMAALLPLGAGAQTITLGTATQVVPAARLVAVAEKTVHAIINDPDHQVRAESRLSDQQVPVGTVTITPEDSQYNPTYIAIPLLISVDGKPIRTVFAGYRIVTYVHTAVAAHDLPAGTVLGAGDVVLGRVAYNGRSPLEATSLVGRKLVVALAHGAPLYMEETQINQIVTPGQPVLYILHDGPVVVSADVIARTGGGMGQTVAVYNPNTRKALSGVVTGPGTVEYTLPGDATE